MDNGNAFLAFLHESVRLLADKKALEYYREPLPSSTDAMLSRMIDRFTAATPQQRKQFHSILSRGQRSLFGIYGHRAATMSLRENSRAGLLRGLIGAVISNFVIPEKRRVDVSLAVFHHCAHKLQLNTVDLFAEAAAYATPEFARRLSEFGRRDDVTLGSFGWEEKKTPEGVTFRFSWR